jgi:uncharacterized DUF497 family protein
MPSDWSPAKRLANLAKHGVDFAAARSFDWSTALVRGDTREGYGEVRMVALGAIDRRPRVLVFTIRRTRIWIISPRKASNREIAHYEREV